MTGTVKMVNPEKGFGFIKPDEGKHDLFFHVKDCNADVDFKELKEGDALQFDVVDAERGPKAVEVSLL